MLPGTMIAIAALAVLAGCEGRTDENIQSAAENQVQAAVNEAEEVAADAGNEFRDIGNAIENEAADARNEIDPGRPDGDNETVATNKQ